jgi:hypothetical protein
MIEEHQPCGCAARSGSNRPGDQRGQAADERSERDGGRPKRDVRERRTRHRHEPGVDRRQREPIDHPRKRTRVFRAGRERLLGIQDDERAMTCRWRKDDRGVSPLTADRQDAGVAAVNGEANVDHGRGWRPSGSGVEIESIRNVPADGRDCQSNTSAGPLKRRPVGRVLGRIESSCGEPSR